MHLQDVLPRDAIPSIDDPSFGPTYAGEADDEVIVVGADPPRAYPVSILNRHEVVNDAVGDGAGPADADRPVAVTWCPICASAAVYDRTVAGRVLTFGVSGTLADDALVMYDRETGSEWKQPLGRCIAGPLEGRDLTAVPATVTAWDRFRDEHPDGVVLQPVYGDANDPRSVLDAYDTTRYEAYADAEGFGLRAMRGEGRERSWDRDDIGPKTVVLGVVRGDAAVGYPVPAVEAAGGLVTDTVGDVDLVVVSADGIHAYADPGHAFDLRDGTLYGDGAAWDPATGRSDDGRQLSRVPSRRLYAFAWQDDHGPDSFYGLGGDGGWDSGAGSAEPPA